MNLIFAVNTLHEILKNLHKMSNSFIIDLILIIKFLELIKIDFKFVQLKLLIYFF